MPHHRTDRKMTVHWRREHPGHQLPQRLETCYQLQQLPDPLDVDTSRVQQLLAAKRKRAEAAAKAEAAAEATSAPASTTKAAKGKRKREEKEMEEIHLAAKAARLATSR
jgi:hypothetical protein